MGLELTEEQDDAIKPRAGHVWVEACPGSGKTRVALAKILSTAPSLKPHQLLLALSFSRAAQGEIQGRLDAIAGPSIHGLTRVRTIHGFCLEEIVSQFSVSPTGAPYRLSVKGSRAFLAAAATTSVRYGVPVSKIDRALKLTRRTAEGIPENSANTLSEVQREYCITFWNELESKGFVDYTSLLYRALDILQARTWLTRSLATKFPIIIVDEFQDCTEIHVKIFETFASEGSKLFLIGDLYQSIFGFVGANPGQLQSSIQRLAAEVIPLTGNRRCSGNVVALAERIFPRGMKSAGDAALLKGTVKRYETNQAENLLDFIQFCDRENITREQIAFISNAQQRIGDTIAFLSRKGIGAVAGRSSESDDWHTPLIEAYVEAVFNSSQQSINRLSEAFSDLVKICVTDWIPSESLLSMSRYAAKTVAFSGDSRFAGSVAEAVNHIHSRIAEAIYGTGLLLDDHHSTLCEILNEQSLPFGRFMQAGDVIANSLDSRGKVRGFTFQSIKGLQFDAVYIMDIIDGRMPHFSMNNVWDDLRKLYVGITRARTHLRVCAAEGDNESVFLSILRGSPAEEVIGSSPDFKAP